MQITSNWVRLVCYMAFKFNMFYVGQCFFPSLFRVDITPYSTLNFMFKVKSLSLLTSIWTPTFTLLTLISHSVSSLFLPCKNRSPSKISAWPLPLQFSNAANKLHSRSHKQMYVCVCGGGYILSFLRQLWKINLEGKKPFKALKHTTYGRYIQMHDLKRISCNLKCWRQRRRLTQTFYLPSVWHSSSLLP